MPDYYISRHLFLHIKYNTLEWNPKSNGKIKLSEYLSFFETYMGGGEGRGGERSDLGALFSQINVSF